MATANQGNFQGFQLPNTTQIPNQVFDTLMSHLSGGELKVLLYICRRTFGFRKDSDSISLSQIAKGITTKAGRVLDQGTGLSKRQVQRALRVLESRKVILVERKVDESGSNEINTYRLNVRGEDKMSLGVETPGSRGVGTSVSLRVETPVSTTKQREQKKEIQNKDIVVDVVAQDLENFGIAKSTATRLMHDYPAEYIREKLEMAQGLVAAESCLVSQNPAGWLRKAIEEDYSPPRTYERARQRHAIKEKDTQRAKREAGERQIAKEECRQGKAEATSDVAEAKEQLVEQYPPQPVEEEGLTPTTSGLTTEDVWNKALEKLKEDLPASDAGEAETRLNGTTLAQVTDTAARILVPSTNALLWLERRMYREICKAMKEVVGKDLDLQFASAT
jgi:phage replication O-like protein O